MQESFPTAEEVRNWKAAKTHQMNRKAYNNNNNLARLLG
jgi:hypothetical protein